MAGYACALNKKSKVPASTVETEETEGEEESDKLVELQGRILPPILRKTATEIKPESRSADGKPKMLDVIEEKSFETEVEMEESKENVETIEERSPKFKVLPVEEIEEKSIEIEPETEFEESKEETLN